MTAPVRRFLHTETAGAALLGAAAVAALLWANSPWSASYAELWSTTLPGWLRGVAPPDLRHVVNDLAMALFFFLAGLEIKRELVRGELRSPRAAALPIGCALGGMAVPAMVFLAFNAGAPTARGWGVPMATDIAFALGALALVGRRLPAGLRVFLLTLAIVDDVGAIVVIALVYSSGVRGAWLLLAGGALAAVALARHRGVDQLPAYVALAAIAWFGCFRAGVHPTIAGVALGLMTPAVPLAGRGGDAPLDRLARALHPWSAYGVLPLFALANAGVDLSGGLDLTSPVALGVMAGLVVGKPLGILGAAALLCRAGWASLPTGVRWSHLAGTAMLAGIGFTVSLFISGLAFSTAHQRTATAAVLVSSLVAASLGLAWLRVVARPTS